MLTQDKDEKHSSSPKYAVHGGFKLAPLSYMDAAPPLLVLLKYRKGFGRKFVGILGRNCGLCAGFSGMKWVYCV